jgi:hypothetical protein
MGGKTKNTIDFPTALQACNKVGGYLAAKKRGLIARAWSENRTTLRELQEASGISPITAQKYRAALIAAQEHEGIAYTAPEPPAPPEPTKPAELEMPENSAPISIGTATDGTPLITGPNYLAMLESLMLSAHQDGRVKDFKDLSIVRNAIVDVGAQLPQTAVDIERTLGHEGLQGMDKVLSETMAYYTDHWASFPNLHETLCAIFAQDPETFKPQPLTPPDPPDPESGGGEETVNVAD